MLSASASLAVHTSHSHSSGKIHQPSKTPTTEPTPAAASSDRERDRDRDRERERDRDRDRESGRGQSNVPPPVRQRASTSGSAAGGQLKARVPPPVPPRGSPRRKDAQDTSRAHSTTPGTAPYNTNPSSTAASVSVSSSNLLQLPGEAMPRFGERRSPSNVQDWLELHDLFDVCDTVPHPSASPASRRRESLQSAYSVVRSESVSHRQQQPPRLLNHVDIFQRQNSFMARSDRSSVGSIVRSFPPIRAESYRTARTSVSAQSSHRSPRRMQQQQLKQLKRHEKRNRYLHCVDLALGDDNCESGQEDNLLQSVSAFLEVKRELEGVYNRRRPLPTLQVEHELSGEQQQEQELIPAEPTPASQRPARRGKRRAPKAAPSTIPESTDSLSNAATQHDSLDLRRNSCV